MIKFLKKALILIGLLFAAAIIIILALFLNELRTLVSLKQVDEYAMYTMTYYGDYGFDEFLEVGAKSDSDIEDFVIKRLLKGVDIDLDVVGDGCTAFVTSNDTGQIIFGRNFDFQYAPSLQLITNPKNGYKSISTVNLSFIGYNEDYLPNALSFDSFLTLAAPFLPFDGMNEKGLAIALLAVPEVQLANDPSKITLNTTTAIRLVLDKAATIEEAVELLKNYNIYFSGDVDCHFLIADASGDSVIVEYWDNQVQSVTSNEEYQIASNFIAYNGLNIGEGYTEFDRYNKVKETLDANNGKINEENAVSLLSEIGIYDDLGKDKLQWSVIYNLTSLEGRIFAHRNTNNIQYFELD